MLQLPSVNAGGFVFAKWNNLLFGMLVLTTVGCGRSFEAISTAETMASLSDKPCSRQPAPAPPSNFIGTAGSTSVALSWNASSTGGVSYIVSRNSSHIANVGSALSYTDQALASGSTYNYSVVAQSSCGKSPAVTLSISTLASAPSPTPSPVSGSATWNNSPFSVQTGSFQVAFEAVPSASGSGEDSTVGLSAQSASAYTDLAAIVRFNSSGSIDVRNGGAYAADTNVPYSARASYHIRMVVDVPAHIYSVYITASGRPEILLASNYAFRSEQASVASLANFGSFSSIGGVSVAGFTLSNPSSPSPSPTPSPGSAPVPDITSFSGSDGALIYVDGFPFGVQNANQNWSLTQPDSQTLRFELRSGDYWYTTTRTEIEGSRTLFPMDSTINISYQFQLEPGATNTAEWIVLGQFHNDDLTTSPPFEIDLVNGDHMGITVGSTSTLGGGLTNIGHYQNQNYGKAYIDPNPIQRGHYYSMRIQIKYDVNGNGFLNVWRDGIQIVSYVGSIGFNFGNGTYWKEGIYRAPAPETMAADYRNLVISYSP